MFNSKRTRWFGTLGEVNALKLLDRLKECTDLESVKKIHAKVGGSANVYVLNSLIDRYAKCGSMADARVVFTRIPHLQRTTVSWNVIIQGYAENGEEELALGMYSRMVSDGWCSPDARTLVAVLKGCSCLAAKADESGHSLERARFFDNEVERIGCRSNVFVASSLIDLYAKCGSLREAQRVFDTIVIPDVVSWNALILGYAEHGEEDMAIEMLNLMKAGNCSPDTRTFVALLKACAKLALKEKGKDVGGRLVKVQALYKGMGLHSDAYKSGFDCHVYVGSVLVDMYAECTSLLDARQAFDRMPSRNIVSWNSLMLGYAQNGEGELTLQIFECLRDEGYEPDARSFVAALKACIMISADHKTVALQKGSIIHSQVTVKCFESFVMNTLVDMYAKCGSLEEATQAFNVMPCRNMVSWNVMMLGYVEVGDGQQALELYACMRSEGYRLDGRTSVVVLKACGILASVELVKRAHTEIACYGLEMQPVLEACLVDTYGKCSGLSNSQHLFDSVPEATSSVTWNGLMMAHSRHGMADQVFCLFSAMEMEGVHADTVTFIAVLTVCSHAGLVSKAKEYFFLMRSLRYGVAPAIEHYHCIIDILGRANELGKAVEMVKVMPYRPNAVTWRIILAASRKWSDVVAGRIAFESMVQIDTKDGSAYVLMSSIYGKKGMWEEQVEIEARRINSGASRKSGRSWWTDEAGVVHSFTVGGAKHPQQSEIDNKLKEIQRGMKEDGYVAQVGTIVHNISDNGKEETLCEHSERQAIACALINAVPGKTIRIIKNLRICEDCHAATAFISKLERRQIICRDVTRFHVFKEGTCSCGDYW